MDTQHYTQKMPHSQQSPVASLFPHRRSESALPSGPEAWGNKDGGCGLFCPEAEARGQVPHGTERLWLAIPGAQGAVSMPKAHGSDWVRAPKDFLAA